jgi:hypothetical protein
MSISHFLDSNRVWVFDSIFSFQYNLVLYTMQEPSYPGKITPVLVWFRRVLTQIIKVFKDPLTLPYPPHTNIWPVSQFDTSRVWVLDGTFCFWYSSDLYTMKEPSYPRYQYRPSINMVYNGIDPNYNQVYKDSLTLTYPPDFNIWLVLQFWYTW